MPASPSANSKKPPPPVPAERLHAGGGGAPGGAMGCPSAANTTPGAARSSANRVSGADLIGPPSGKEPIIAPSRWTRDTGPRERGPGLALPRRLPYDVGDAQR